MAVHTNKGTLIIGGGAIGLATGWRLAQRGEPVVLLERRETGREASWASAGLLLAASHALDAADPFQEMRLESQALYPAFVAELEEASGQRVDYRTHGTLYVALVEEEVAELREAHRAMAERAPVRWVERAELRVLEPNLSPNAVAGLLNPKDTQVDNRRLVAALRQAFLNAGGTLHENTPAERLELRDDGPPLVMAAGKTWAFEKVLLTAGAWSGLLPELDGMLRPLIRPVKGQILALKPEVGAIHHALVTGDAYFAPREDGRIVIGATQEEDGFNPTITVGAVQELLRAATRALPNAHAWPLHETWCGFRPGSVDSVPILGATDVPGLYLATGHFRSGILTTPVTAKHLCDVLLGGQLPDFMQPFTLARFAGGRETAFRGQRPSDRG